MKIETRDFTTLLKGWVPLQPGRLRLGRVLRHPDPNLSGSPLPPDEPQQHRKYDARENQFERFGWHGVTQRGPDRHFLLLANESSRSRGGPSSNQVGPPVRITDEARGRTWEPLWRLLHCR